MGVRFWFVLQGTITLVMLLMVLFCIAAALTSQGDDRSRALLMVGITMLGTSVQAIYWYAFWQLRREDEQP